MLNAKEKSFMPFNAPDIDETLDNHKCLACKIPTFQLCSLIRQFKIKKDKDAKELDNIARERRMSFIQDASKLCFALFCVALIGYAGHSGLHSKNFGMAMPFHMSFVASPPLLWLQWSKKLVQNFN